jgi:tetratricopeptide (TPR) repeat protein
MRYLLLGWSLGVAVGCAGPGTRVVTEAKAPAVQADSGKTAEKARATTLVAEGDAALNVNVDSAIEKYTQALELEPTNVSALWKLSGAYRLKDDWTGVAATLARATALEPDVVAYWRWRGSALVELARDGRNDYEEARESLAKCVHLDPKLAECVFLLGEVEEWAEHGQAAAELYTRAARLDSGQVRYYRALAALYAVFKLPNEQERVLTEGTQRVAPSDESRASMARMSVTLAQLSAARKDERASQGWLERAETYYDEGSPETGYEIGAQYAAAYAAYGGAAKREAALRLLEVFAKRTCRGAAAAKHQEPCQVSAVLAQVLGRDVAPSAPKPAVPPSPVPLPAGLPVPKLVMQPQRAGDVYTVWGASYAFRSRQHHREVTDKPIAIMGYVVKTNLGEAPRCAVHRAGIADPEDCRADIPAFWLGDRPDAPIADSIKVMGFASTYAQLYDAIRQADSEKHDEPYTDTFWGNVIPNPLPARGAKLTVRGRYRLAFAKSSSGAESDAVMGILEYLAREVLEPAPERETLPGLKRPRR